MGNCASEPKTNEGEAPEPEREELVSKIEELKVEDDSQKAEDTPSASHEKSLGTLLDEKETKEAEEPKEEVKEEETKEEEPKAEEVKPEEEKPKTEEAKEEKKTE